MLPKQYEHVDACYDFAEEHSIQLDAPQPLLAISDCASIIGRLYDIDVVAHLIDEIKPDFQMEFLSRCYATNRDPTPDYMDELLLESISLGIYWFFVSEVTRIISGKGIENLTISDFQMDLPESILEHARHSYDEVFEYW